MADTELALIEAAVMDVVLSREGKRRYNNGDPLTLDPSDLRDIVRLTMAKCAALASRPAVAEQAHDLAVAAGFVVLHENGKHRFEGGIEQIERLLASRPAEVVDERQWVVVGGRRAGRTLLAALARDAERYRWMRNAQWFKAGIAKTELNASSFHYSGDLLDQLVDAGRAAGVHGEGTGK